MIENHSPIPVKSWSLQTTQKQKPSKIRPRFRCHWNDQPKPGGNNLPASRPTKPNQQQKKVNKSADWLP